MDSHEDRERVSQLVEGVLVRQISPDSPAARAGIAVGDVIVAVNGQRTRNLDEYLAAKHLARGPLRLVVFRDHAELEIELSPPGWRASVVPAPRDSRPN